jgi:hypothetical protein
VGRNPREVAPGGFQVDLKMGSGMMGEVRAETLEIPAGATQFHIPPHRDIAEPPLTRGFWLVEGGGILWAYATV